MADEIIGLEGGTGRVAVLMFYPIPLAQRIEVPGSPGTYHVVTPSSDLPATGAAYMTQAHKDDLDAGRALFRTKSLPTGLTGQALIDAILAYYDGWKGAILAEYIGRFQYAGLTFDAS